jgi:hypothetical protein
MRWEERGIIGRVAVKAELNSGVEDWSEKREE